MSFRKSVLIRPIAEELRLVTAQVSVNVQRKKAQEILDRKNRICNVVSVRLDKQKETQK